MVKKYHQSNVKQTDGTKKFHRNILFTDGFPQRKRGENHYALCRAGRHTLFTHNAVRMTDPLIFNNILHNINVHGTDFRTLSAFFTVFIIYRRNFEK